MLMRTLLQLYLTTLTGWMVVNFELPAYYPVQECLL